MMCIHYVCVTVVLLSAAVKWQVHLQTAVARYLTVVTFVVLQNYWGFLPIFLLDYKQPVWKLIRKM